MESGETEEIVLVPKEDGTCYIPTVRDEYGIAYAPSRFKNVDKWCMCKDSDKRYCQDWTLHHKVHICVCCNGILTKHIMPFSSSKH